jgi:nucleoside-diphosphate-sugar epimerase
MRSNLEFGTQLLEALCQSKVKTFINTGTSWEHYQNETYNPVNLYAATKHAFEAIIQYYVNVHSFRVVTLKLFDTYGTNDTRPKLMRLLKKTLVGNTPLEMSEGEQLIDLVHIDDIVDAFLIAEKHLQNSRTAGHEQFAISSGNPISLRELVGAFSKISGKELPILFGKKPYRQREVMVPWNNGRKLPGWEPKISLEKGIQAFIKGAN